MKKWILTAVIALFLRNTYAQENPPSNKGIRITGRVIDSLNRSGIEYSTITIYIRGASKPLNGSTSDQSGHFILDGLKANDYTVLIESIGYKSKELGPVHLTRAADINLGDILISKSSKMMSAVTITAPTGLVENKIDKLVYNAEKDLTSQGGVATDILKKVPQVSVDVDGNVELAGSSSIRFLLNGKPSTAFGSNITDVLQSIPASQIKSIEVITNPGARYDAEGLGGIINIILKSSKANGINGNLSVTAGTRNENGSINLNARHGNFGLNIFASGNLRLPATTPFESNRQTYDTTLKTNATLIQDGAFDFKRHGYETGIGFDWVYKKRNNFTGSFNYSNFGNSNSGQLSQSQVIYDNTGSPLSQIVSTNPSTSSFLFYNFDASLAYKKTFVREDQELEISLNTSAGHNQINSFSEQYWQPQDSLFFGTIGNNPGKVKETSFQIDYTQPLKKEVKLGIGGKVTIRDITSNSSVESYQPDNKSYLYNPNLSNSLVYDQKVYAAYMEAGFPVYNWFSAKMGIRYERTDIDANFSNASQQKVTPGYNSFVPSVFLIKKLTDDQTLKLSYSKRIQRPDYRDLNPFVNTTDPKNIVTGNPYLQPEIGHRVELSYSRDLKEGGSFTVTAFYRGNHGDIQPFIIFYPVLTVGDSTYYNVNVTTAENIGVENNFGLSLFSDLHPTKAFGIRTNIFMFQRHTINQIDTGYNSNSFNFRFNINLSYQFPKNFAAEFFGNFNSPRHEAQGKYPSFTSYSFAVRKQIWNKKGSIALMANNPFSEYVVQQTTLFGPGFNTNSVRKIPFRSVSINFTWKFGKLTFKKEKESNDENANQGPDSGQ